MCNLTGPGQFPGFRTLAPDRDCTATVDQSIGLAANGCHSVERITPENRQTVVERLQSFRDASRNNPSTIHGRVIELQLTPGKPAWLPEKVEHRRQLPPCRQRRAVIGMHFEKFAVPMNGELALEGVHREPGNTQFLAQSRDQRNQPFRQQIPDRVDMVVRL